MEKPSLGRRVDYLRVLFEHKLIKVESIHLRYSSGVVDSSNNLAVIVNSIHMMMSVDDYDDLCDELYGF